MVENEKWGLETRIIQEIHMRRKRFHGRFFMQIRGTPVSTTLDPDVVALTKKGMETWSPRQAC